MAQFANLTSSRVYEFYGFRPRRRPGRIRAPERILRLHIFGPEIGSLSRVEGLNLLDLIHCPPGFHLLKMSFSSQLLASNPTWERIYTHMYHLQANQCPPRCPRPFSCHFRLRSSRGVVARASCKPKSFSLLRLVAAQSSPIQPPFASGRCLTFGEANPAPSPINLLLDCHNPVTIHYLGRLASDNPTSVCLSQHELLIPRC